MGIFGNDKEEKKADAPKVEEKKAPKAVTETGVIPANILAKPHLTEKALLAGVKNVYVFQVFAAANKRDVAKAVEEAFNVTVTKVNMAKTPGKKGSRRTKGKAGSKSGIKKAYVTLKDGDKLQLI
tara:strand:+ start:1941 stop:2315 length:375 start_codon:yes stop_codon:yes gene_type:complete